MLQSRAAGAGCVISGSAGGYTDRTVRSNLTTHTTLLNRLSAGQDNAAWADFVSRYGELIRSFARVRGLQSSDCDDLLQDVLISLSKSMPGFEYDPERGRFRSFLKTVVVRAISRRFRKAHAAAPLDENDQAEGASDGDAELDDQWELEWRQYHLRTAMRVVEMEFNEADLMAFKHYAVDGNSPQATAELTGLNPNQIYKAKSNILKRLGEIIAQQVEEEG